jgi:hypothetical protein
MYPEIVIDIDSSKFDKGYFPENYVTHVKELFLGNNTGERKIILVSSHKSVRDELKKQGIEYTLVYPIRDLKPCYLERYRQRGDSEEFIKMMDENWDSFIYGCEKEDCDRMRLWMVDTHLTDVIKTFF